METQDMQGGQATLATDPVCGMDVDPATAAATSEYQGKTYYFCAVGCKNRFDKDPQSYIDAQEP
jgi:Cu+-exporting ATPase